MLLSPYYIIILPVTTLSHFLFVPAFVYSSKRVLLLLGTKDRGTQRSLSLRQWQKIQELPRKKRLTQ